MRWQGGLSFIKIARVSKALVAFSGKAIICDCWREPEEREASNFNYQFNKYWNNLTLEQVLSGPFQKKRGLQMAVSLSKSI